MQTTPAVFHFQEVLEYARFQQASDKALRISLDGIQVAFLYLTPTTYTLAWDGSVNFQHLENEVNSALDAFGWRKVDISNPAWRSRLSVALVLHRNEDFDELMEYHFSISQEYANYSKIIKHPCAISFARYDFSNKASPETIFSFIAENAALHQGLENEVAIKLTRKRKCTEDMIEWIINHHRQYSLLQEVGARDSLVSTLNQYLL